MKRDVFQGIADPTRREILNLIAYKSQNVNSVAGNFDVSRTAIYKHMKILAECGLVVIKQQGRERYCEANLRKLSKVSNWIEQYTLEIQSSKSKVQNPKSKVQNLKSKI